MTPTAALHDGITTGHVSLSPAVHPIPASPARLVAALRDRAGQLLAASAAAGRMDQPVAIADRRLAGGMVAAVGAGGGQLRPTWRRDLTGWQNATR